MKTRLALLGFLVTLIFVVPQNSIASIVKPGAKCLVIDNVVKFGNRELICQSYRGRNIWRFHKKDSSQVENTNNNQSSSQTKQDSSLPDSPNLTLPDFISAAKSAASNIASQIQLDPNNTVKISSSTTNPFPKIEPVISLNKFKLYGPNPLAVQDASGLKGWGMFDNQNKTGVFTSISAIGPWGVEFNLTTTDEQGRFQVINSNYFIPGAGEPYSNLSWRLAFKKDNGSWMYQSISGTSHPTNGKTFFDTVNLGAPGKYQIKLEFEGGTNFFGVSLPDSNSQITPLNNNASLRVVILGDSFTHPTLGESGPHMSWDGYPTQLSWLTDWNVISEGVNGQGILNQSAGEIFGDRIVRDVVPQKPQVVIFVASTNDYCPKCTFSDQQIADEASKDMKKFKSADPNAILILTTSYLGNPNWAASLAKVAQDLQIPFLNFLSPPMIDMSQQNQPYVNGHPTRLGGYFIATNLLKDISQLSK